MRSRQVAIQGGVAALGLIAAYTTWQREPETKVSFEAVVIDANKHDIVSVRFEDETAGKDKLKWVELTPGKDSDGSPSVTLKISANAQTKSPERELRGAEGAQKLLDKFAPLRANRSLGVVTAEKQKELGLDAPKKTLIVTTKSGKRTFVVAQPPKFTVSDPYVMDEQKKVYVLGGGVLSDLDSAAVRFVDRQMHAFKQNELDGIVITVGNKKRELVQQAQAPEGAPKPGPQGPVVKIASKKSPDKPDELAKNWLDKLWRAFGTDMLGKGEKPEGGDPALVAKVEYLDHGKSKGFIELGQVQQAGQGPLVSAPSTTVTYARTEHTVGWVKMPANITEALKEVDKIVAE